MATSQEQWTQAFEILEHFERKLIEPKEFNWTYFKETTGVSKATLWRNENFRSEHARISKLIKKYKEKNADYDLEQSILSVKDHEILELKKQIFELEKKLGRERERLAYAAIIARQSNIDPNRFMEESPLLKAQANAKKNEINTPKIDDKALDRFRKKQ
ncbi:hypothetical protein [Shewanella woodyi]|uniref:Uncharacterized protein n=1 Tax=Shewanella woodyi (strain ATCC 51908 / MS32) TaxID=392500 RepID=B1KNB2_SHEWM|nr:hypothetical protein [Shewanella woodyi]ACA84609.1 conserved hypothetical protein [Shewanella woodyi ATCC 51908]